MANDEDKLVEMNMEKMPIFKYMSENIRIIQENK
jgi:hypothetical protein